MMKPTTASKLLSAFLLTACYLLAQFAGFGGAIMALVITVITTPFHFVAWHNKVNKW